MEPMILWFVGTILFWIVIPVGIVYLVRRFLRAYERRTDVMSRVEALELRLARLEYERTGEAPPRTHS